MGNKIIACKISKHNLNVLKYASFSRNVALTVAESPGLFKLPQSAKCQGGAGVTEAVNEGIQTAEASQKPSFVSRGIIGHSVQIGSESHLTHRVEAPSINYTPFHRPE